MVRGLTAKLTTTTTFFMLDLTPHKKEQAIPIAHASDDQPGDPPMMVNGKINWVPFDKTTIKANLERGRPIFMDFTADWCANCKTNEKLFIETKTIHSILTKTNILPIKIDFTNENNEIEKWISDLERTGIPIYVVLHPDGHRDLLPETITTDILSTTLERAAEKYPAEKFAPAKTTSSSTEPTSDKHATNEEG